MKNKLIICAMMMAVYSDNSEAKLNRSREENTGTARTVVRSFEQPVIEVSTIYEEDLESVSSLLNEENTNPAIPVVWPFEQPAIVAPIPVRNDRGARAGGIRDPEQPAIVAPIPVRNDRGARADGIHDPEQPAIAAPIPGQNDQGAAAAQDQAADLPPRVIAEWGPMQTAMRGAIKILYPVKGLGEVIGWFGATVTAVSTMARDYFPEQSQIFALTQKIGALSALFGGLLYKGAQYAVSEMDRSLHEFERMRREERIEPLVPQILPDAGNEIGGDDQV